MQYTENFRAVKYEKVKEGNDQEMAQSERNSHSKNRGEKKRNRQYGSYTQGTYKGILSVENV